MFSQFHILPARRALCTGLATAMVAVGSLAGSGAANAQSLTTAPSSADPTLPLHAAGTPAQALLTLRPGISIALSFKQEMGAVAKVLSISEDQLRTELQGSSLTNVAHAHHVDPQVVAAALTSARRAEIDQAVRAGTLPAEVAATMRSRLYEAIAVEMSMTWSTVTSAPASTAQATAGPTEVRTAELRTAELRTAEPRAANSGQISVPLGMIARSTRPTD